MAATHTSRPQAKLSARAVETITRPGRYSDGGNLYLDVDPSGAKRWTFIYRWRNPNEPRVKGQRNPGRIREMGLGPAVRDAGLTKPDGEPPIGSLAWARQEANRWKEALRAGRSPIDVRLATRAAALKAEQEEAAAQEAAAQEAAARLAVPTFGEVADRFLPILAEGVKSERSVARYRRALKVYAGSLSDIPIDAVTTAHVLDVLRPLWSRLGESARMTQRYLERLFDTHEASQYRSDNPAQWKALKASLPVQAPSGEHHAAMDYAALPAFIEELRTHTSLAAAALEFTILTVVRTGEVLGARWSELDLEAAVWTIPGKRMKMGKEHRVPLCGRALELLAIAQQHQRPDGLVWPGQGGPGQPLSNMAMLALLQRRMGRKDATVHGFRSTFRDWAGDCTEFPRELVETALAHAVGDETEQAYRRRDALLRRRVLMDAWATYCEPKRANVVALHGGARRG